MLPSPLPHFWGGLQRLPSTLRRTAMTSGVFGRSCIGDIRIRRLRREHRFTHDADQVLLAEDRHRQACSQVLNSSTHPPDIPWYGVRWYRDICRTIHAPRCLRPARISLRRRSADKVIGVSGFLISCDAVRHIRQAALVLRGDQRRDVVERHDIAFDLPRRDVLPSHAHTAYASFRVEDGDIRTRQLIRLGFHCAHQRRHILA